MGISTDSSVGQLMRAPCKSQKRLTTERYCIGCSKEKLNSHNTENNLVVIVFPKPQYADIQMISN